MLGGTEQVIRRPTEDDLAFIVENIRECDVKEVLAMSKKTISECLDETPDLDKNSWVWEYEGKVMCIFGVNPVEDNIGVIWMLATKHFENKAIIFASACKKVLVDLIQPFYYVFNYVHVENKGSIEWLKWLGFTVSEPVPIGINGAKFHHFEKWNRPCVIQ